MLKFLVLSLFFFFFFEQEMEIIYQISETTKVQIRTTESHDTIKPSLPVISLSVIKCVGMSQNGEWMSTMEIMIIRIHTLLIFKCGDYHPQ